MGLQIIEVKETKEGKERDEGTKEGKKREEGKERRKWVDIPNLLRPPAGILVTSNYYLL